MRVRHKTNRISIDIIIRLVSLYSFVFLIMNNRFDRSVAKEIVNKNLKVISVCTIRVDKKL